MFKKIEEFRLGPMGLAFVATLVSGIAISLLGVSTVIGAVVLPILATVLIHHGKAVLKEQT